MIPGGVERELPVAGKGRDTDTDEPERAGPVAEAAVEERAGQLGDRLVVVDRRWQRRRARPDREVGVPQLGRDRPRCETPAAEMPADLDAHPPQLGVQCLAVAEVTGEGLLDGDRDLLAAELEVAVVDSAGTVAQDPADAAGEHRPQVGVREHGEGADAIDPGRVQASLGARPDPWETANRIAERKRASAPGGTTVIPPGLRRSEATLQTTFAVETPSEQDRLVAARTAVCTASAAPRARSKSPPTALPRSR